MRQRVRTDKKRRLADLEQSLIAALKGPKIELSVSEIQKKVWLKCCANDLASEKLDCRERKVLPTLPPRAGELQDDELHIQQFNYWNTVQIILPDDPLGVSTSNMAARVAATSLMVTDS